MHLDVGTVIEGGVRCLASFLAAVVGPVRDAEGWPVYRDPSERYRRTGGALGELLQILERLAMVAGGRAHEPPAEFVSDDVAIVVFQPVGWVAMNSRV